ncbi:MAG: ArsA family ATPase [Chloroflexi bacterium]|nr:ArsA family ATPase [Chloroflexota bacterium]
MRILLYTGKGGVGKTSVAAASAVRCADMGFKTAVISTDAAHSLADSFDIPLGPELVQIGPNLWGQEMDVLHQMDVHWGKVQDWLEELLSWRGVDSVVASEATVLPGMDELASLLQIVYLVDSHEWDVLVVDAAPTGETLRLLSMPDVAQWYLTRIFPVQRKANQLVGPLIGRLTDLPMPKDEVFQSIEELVKQLNRMQEILTDPELTSMRLVLNPEKMVIKEAQRTFTYLNLYGFPTDMIVENRIIPEDVRDPHFDTWKVQQAKYTELVEQAFSPVPIFKAPLFDQEVVGIEMLRKMAEAIYGERNPTTVFFRGKTHEIKSVDGGYTLELSLPFVTKEEVKLSRVGDELIIRLGNWKRHIVLPRALVNLQIQRARLEQDTLNLFFANSQGTKRKGR